VALHFRARAPSDQIISTAYAPRAGVNCRRSAKVSPTARRKAISRRAEDGQPVHSFRTLLQDLANLTRNSVRFGDARPTTILSRPTPTQIRAFELLGLKIAA